MTQRCHHWRIVSIDDRPHLQPVAAIPAEREAPGLPVFDTPLAVRWGAVTRPLPLHGGGALVPFAGERSRLVALLGRDAPWLGGLARAVAEDVALAHVTGRPWLRLQPTLLLGPPGIGKSHGAWLIARLSGCGVPALDLAGQSDNRSVQGTSRGWTNTWPSWPVRAMAETSSANPIMIGDEIDKCGGSNDRGGSVHDALLPLLEPSTAARYHDACLATEVDAGEVSWCFTANSLATIPRPFLSRLRVVEVRGPGREHAGVVVEGVLADLARGWGIDQAMLPPLPRSSLRIIADTLAATGSIRAVRRQVEVAIGQLMAERPRRPDA